MGSQASTSEESSYLLPETDDPFVTAFRSLEAYKNLHLDSKEPKKKHPHPEPKFP